MENVLIRILMSTYNGEKYVEEQIKSILNQKDVEVEMLIRDDGSTDRTVDIIHELADRDKRITFYVGNNVGPAKSFFELTEKAGDYQYYAFSDQDDYWEEDKLISAIKLLKRHSQTKPLLYYSNLSVTDERLNFVRLMHSRPQRIENKYVVLTEYYGTGCTMVFNRAARDLYINNLPRGEIMHDLWMTLICAFTGTIEYDWTPHILYRQHHKNVIGATLTCRDIVRSKLKRALRSEIAPRYNYAKIFLDNYGEHLNPADREKIERITNYKKGIKFKASLLFDKDIRSSTLPDEIKYRLLIIRGAI